MWDQCRGQNLGLRPSGYERLYKNELIKRKGPWRNAEHVGLATLAYIEWFNHRRLHSEIGDMEFPLIFGHLS